MFQMIQLFVIKLILDSQDGHRNSIVSLPRVAYQVQAAPVIRGLSIRGFDYSWVVQRGKTANSKEIS
jgi:hypothetical protein